MKFDRIDDAITNMLDTEILTLSEEHVTNDDVLFIKDMYEGLMELLEAALEDEDDLSMVDTGIRAMISRTIMLAYERGYEKRMKEQLDRDLLQRETELALERMYGKGGYTPL